MLKPEYFEGKERKLLEIFQKLENFIMKDIARRLLQAGEMTGTADRLIWKIEQMGKSQERIRGELQKLTSLSRKELQELLRNAVMTSWKDDADTLKQVGTELTSPLENKAIIEVMDAQYRKTQGELENLTRTTMNQAQQDLINLLDEADMKTAGGAQSYNAAIADVLDAYAGRGIMVDYPSGTRRTLEAAARCCVITSMNQTTAQVTNQYVKEADTNIVLVSAHVGARTGEGLAGHCNWQGRAYSVRGSEPGFPNLLESTGYDINPETGVGVVVNPLGLHGYNCRHSHKPWDKRLRNPYLDEKGNLKIGDEENRKQYELSQKQRAIERGIRKTKRQLIVKHEEINAASGADRDKLQAEYDRMAYKLTEQNKRYNDFCKENNLQTQYDRNKVADFGRAQEKAANKGAKRYTQEN